MGLKLTFGINERIFINDDITITLTRTGKNTQLDFDAPPEVDIQREREPQNRAVSNVKPDHGQTLTIDQQAAMALRNIRKGSNT